MPRTLTERSWLRRLLPSFLLTTALCAPALATSWYMRPWMALYREVHPDAPPKWKSFNDARRWAREEQHLVEPVLLRALNSEYPDIPWTSALPIAQEVPTVAVRDLLDRRLRRIVDGLPDACLGLDSEETGAVTSMIDVLGDAADLRVVPVALALISKDCQQPLVVEHAVRALRQLGGQETIERLRAVPLRQRYAHIDRQCALAEKALDARLSGDDILADAEAELQMLTRRYVEALETKDAKAYVELQVFHYRQLADEATAKDLLERPDMLSLAQAIRHGTGRESFEVDRRKLAARLLVDDRYELIYVYEFDGWKIAGFEPVPP